MDITRWSTSKSDWLYSLQPKMVKLYTVSKARLGANCGSGHELVIARFRLKLKRVGKTARPLRYEINWFPYNYTVEVTNRFKGLDLINSAWRTMDGGLWHCTGDRNQNHPQEKEMQKSKMVVWKSLQIAVKRREAKSKGKRYPFECTE